MWWMDPDNENYDLYHHSQTDTQELLIDFIFDNSDIKENERKK